MRKEIEKKLNVSYIEFISELIKNKIVVGDKNKENIVKRYNEKVKLNFNNVSRVSNRCERKEIVEKLDIILKENNMEKKEFLVVSEKVRNLSRRNGSNYFQFFFYFLSKI